MSKHHCLKIDLVLVVSLLRGPYLDIPESLSNGRGQEHGNCGDDVGCKEEGPQLLVFEAELIIKEISDPGATYAN
jgi:hypothetical protein